MVNMSKLFERSFCSNDSGGHVCNDSQVRFHNLTDDEKIEVELLAAHLVKEVVIFIIIIFVIGMIGNIMFLLLVIRVQDMRTVTNFYLANVAVADMLFLLLETTGTITELQQGNLPFDTDIACALFYFVRHLSFFGSILLITLVSFERFIAVCYPLHHHYMKENWRSMVLTIITWVVSAIFAMLVALKYSKVKYVCVSEQDSNIFKFCFGKNFHFCDPLHPALADVANIVKGVPFFIAAILNTTFYACIIKRLRRPFHANDETNNRHKKRLLERDKKRKQITIMLVANSIIFFLCLTPGQLVILQNLSFLGKPLLNHTHVFEKHILYTVIMLNVLNSAVNPIIYGVASPGYRRGFIKAVGFNPISKIEPTSIAT